jgi:hypothetical protein
MTKLVMDLKKEIIYKVNELGLGKMITLGVCLILISWIGLSFAEVISNNMGSYSYHSWNFFNIMMKLAGK